MGYVAR